MINFDLHIHSLASKYKETDGVVDNSTKENAHVLLEKLNSYNISLFSITDHNRFDIELYEEFDRILKEDSEKYPNVKCLLAGVEFDVNLESGMESCHIIAIFDAKNNQDNYAKICEGIAAVKTLEKKDEYYTRKEFETILKNIELPVILIAHQKKSMGSSTGKHRSLSDSTSHPDDLIKLGFISALEIQKDKVEGILKNELQKIGIDVALVYGSDCHDWSVYPCHDSLQSRLGFETPPHAEILPTFKGLLMAVTSPKTRFKRSANSNTNYFKSILIDKATVELRNGLNVIIGENGAGKSTLLELLYCAENKNLKSYVNDLRRENSIKIPDKVSMSRIQYVRQNEIINSYNKGINDIFQKTQQESLFLDVNNTNFENAYKRVGEEIKKHILYNINFHEDGEKLKAKYWNFSVSTNAKTFYVRANVSPLFANIKNQYQDACDKLLEIIEILKSLLEDKALSSFVSILSELKQHVCDVMQVIASKLDEKKAEQIVKNAIEKAIRSYNHRIEGKSSTIDSANANAAREKVEFIGAISSYIIKCSDEVKFPSSPKQIDGASVNSIHGFKFNRVAKYHQIDLYEEFLKTLFNKNYITEKAIKEIDTFEKFASAVKNCSTTTSKIDILRAYDRNVENFIAEQKKTDCYITDLNSKSIGNTLGEMALAYYEYITYVADEWDVLLIDQPEDNISNKNVQERLSGYLSSLRDKKQIIYVTHNPLMVVNIDADNVIYVKNEGGKIKVYSGSLEFENENTDILNLIAENMDGGKEAVQRRVRVYD